MSSEKKPTLTQQIAELKEVVGAQEALIEGLIRDNQRLIAFAEKAAPFLNALRQERQQSQNTPPFVPTNSQPPRTAQPPQNRQAAPQQRPPAIKVLPKRQPPQNTTVSPAHAAYEQYKALVKAKAIETGKSLTILPFSQASTMPMEQLVATIK